MFTGILKKVREMMQMLKQISKYSFLFDAGGVLYVLIELAWLGWGVWDYSGIPGNILGQICPQYTVLWMPVSLAGIILDDWIRYRAFGEERPRYNIGVTRYSKHIVWLPE